MTENIDVKIKVGYKGSGDVIMFDGGVLYISNNRTNTKTTQAIILCASKLVAKFSQSRINLTLNSGLNLYSAAKYVLSKAGIKNPNISKGLKSQIIKNVQNVNDTAGGWLNKLLENNNSFVFNSDNSFSSTVTLFDAANSQNRYITLTNKILDLTGGYPQISSEGLRLTCMPTYNFMCGDIIKIDNSVIQAPISSQKALTSPSTFFIDEDGEYIIFEIAAPYNPSAFHTILLKIEEKISRWIFLRSLEISLGKLGGQHELHRQPNKQQRFFRYSSSVKKEHYEGFKCW